MECQPIDRGLNTAILAMADRVCPAGFDVSDAAPDTYRKLKAHLDAGNRMVVAKSGSEGTIYGEPEVNYAFRAWHDWCHWRGEHDFTPEGELAVFRMQAWHLRQTYGATEQSLQWARILEAEVVGQRLYYEAHKTYVTDQRAFIQAYMVDPLRAVVKEW